MNPVCGSDPLSLFIFEEPRWIDYLLGDLNILNLLKNIPKNILDSSSKNMLFTGQFITPVIEISVHLPREINFGERGSIVQ